MFKSNYGLFYDFHTSTDIPDVGENFDAEAFTDQLKSCKVDFLTWHARCNQGNAYYDTRYGKRHPSLKFDMIRAIGEACRRKGITFSVYFNGHFSDEELLQHRDWMNIEFKGDTYHTYDERGFFTPGLRASCYNSPYRDHLMNMVRELLENYPVDGFFFDCLGAASCICPYCVKEMKEKGIDCTDQKAVHAFGVFSVQRFCRDLNDLIRKIKPDALLFFNGRPAEESGDMLSHLECECLPTSFWGYESLPVYAHYLRTVAKGRTVMNMTGRFNTWGDFGGLRTAEGLEYDLFYGAANGMRPDIGGHFHPRGDMDLPVFDRIREVYNNIQQYDEWVLDAVNEPEIALVYPLRGEDYRPSGPAESAVRMLTELKVQFDLVTTFVPWDRYKLLIFPDDVVFTEEVVKRVEAHLKKGGKILATSRSGLDPEGKKFALSSWPAVYQGKIPYDPLYFMPAGPLAEGLPAMPLSVYASGTRVQAAKDAVTEMFLVKPYLPGDWDGLRSNYYNPPEKVTNEPFLVRSEQILYISAELFTGYAKRAPKQLRELLGKAIVSLVPELKFTSSTLPSFSRAFVQKKGNTELVHLLAYCPEGRGQASALEDRITLVDTEIALRTDGKKVRKVYLAPDRRELAFREEGNYCKVRIPMMTGFALAVFEY
ncbi:MAG: beta-galactosidase trimerization domain-containing protein [Lentisphaeria bacterium]|nr:beta-galactosidase trimerization domain-containing protein [Lentisphaeria bacterium]